MPGTTSPTLGPTQFPTSRPSTPPSASPTYNTAAIDGAKVAYDAVLAKYNCSAGAPTPVFAAKAGATAAKGELETVFTAYKVTVRDHMKVLLSDKQWEKYDAKVVLSKFQGDQILFGECKRKIRSLRKAALLQVRRAHAGAAHHMQLCGTDARAIDLLNSPEAGPD